MENPAKTGNTKLHNRRTNPMPCSKGRHLTEEHKAKISLAKTGTHFSEEMKAKMNQTRIQFGSHNPFYGKHHTEESKAKMSLSHLGRHPTEETRMKMSQSAVGKQKCLGYHHTDEAKRNMGLAHVGNKNNLGHKASPETRAKMSLALLGNQHTLGYRHTEEAKAKMSLTRIGNQINLGRKATLETKAKLSCIRKAYWQYDERVGKHIEHILQAQHIKPNNAESTLLALLEIHFPNEWKYVGDGSFVIGKLNPDFVNVNGKKQVIELFGDYWHRGQTGKERASIFADYGFSTLIIWESDLNNPDKVVAKLTEFCGLGCGASQSRASKSSNTLGKCRDFIRDTPSGGGEKVQS